MVVRVSVVDAQSAEVLIRRLTTDTEAEDVSFDSARQQVCIDVGKNAEQALVRILSLVEEWLGDGGRAPTNVEIDAHRYVLAARAAAVSAR
jgi:hypothetical protein